MQQLRAVLRKVPVDDRGQHLGAAQPAPETNELGKFFVVHFVHRLLHAVLGAVEFLPHRRPVTAVRCLRDRLGVGHDRAPHPNALGQTNDTLADLLHTRRVLRLHRDEAVGDDRPEEERDPRALGEIGSFVRADEFLPVHAIELVERAEDFVGQRHDHVVDIFREAFDVDAAGRFRRRGLKAQESQHAAGQKNYFSERSHPQLRLLLSRRYSGLVGHFMQNRTAAQIAIPSRVIKSEQPISAVASPAD